MFKTSYGKQIQNIANAHFICLMYNLITSSINSGSLCIGFDDIVIQKSF